MADIISSISSLAVRTLKVFHFLLILDSHSLDPSLLPASCRSSHLEASLKIVILTIVRPDSKQNPDRLLLPASSILG